MRMLGSCLKSPLLARAVAVLPVLVSGIGFTGASAQTPQARFSGRITNGDGGPVPSAVVVLCNEDVDLWSITSTDDAGAFDLTELPANEFSVEVLSPLWRRPNTGQVWGFRPWTGSISLQSGQNLKRDIRLGDAARQPLAPKTPPPCSPSRPFAMVGSERLARLLIHQTTPVYPQSVKDVNSEVQVTLEAFMNKDGKVISLRLLAPSWPPKVDPVLTRAAVETVRDWRYSPPQPVSGEVFEFTGKIVVDFARDR